MCHICMYLISIVVSQYDASLSSLLDKHAPSKRSYVVEKPMNDWVTDDMLVLKALCRKYESLWRKTRLPVRFHMYSESCMAVKKQLVRVNLGYCTNKSQNVMVIRKRFFKTVDTLLGRNKQTALPKYDSPLPMASVMNNFFIDKIDNILAEFPLLKLTVWGSVGMLLV